AWRPRLRQLDLALLSQGNAARDRAASGPGGERGGRNAGGQRAVQIDRRDRPAARAPDAGLSNEIRAERDRAMGGSHQGERRERRVRCSPLHRSFPRERESSDTVRGPGSERNSFLRSRAHPRWRSTMSIVSSYGRPSSSSKPAGAAKAALADSSTTASASGMSQPPARAEASACSASKRP